MEGGIALQLENQEDFVQNLSKSLNQLRKDGRFCDVNFFVNGKCVKAHRNVLVARSQYFEAMFSGNFQEPEMGVINKDMSDCVEEAEDFENFINTMYEGYCFVSTFNIFTLYQLATYFMFEELKERLVVELISLTNRGLKYIVRLYKLALTYEISELEEICLKVIQARFHDHFIYQSSILELTVHEMERLFSSDVHKYCPFPKIVLFLSKWIGNNLADKQKYESVSLSIIQKLAGIVDYMDLDKTQISFGDQIICENLSGFMFNVQEIIHTASEDLKTEVERTPNNLILSSEPNCLVLVVPSESVVLNIMGKTDHEDKRIYQSKHCVQQLMKLAMYDINRRSWLDVGEFTPPAKFDNKNSWRAACLNDKVYFISLYQMLCFSLCLKSLKQEEIKIDDIVRGFDGNVRSVVPVAVDSQLFVLVSDSNRPRYPEEYITRQRYFKLEDDLTWSFKGEVEHGHSSTPTSLVNAYNKKIIVVKASKNVNLGQNLLEIRDGHMFDVVTSEVKKFQCPCYLSSPVRLLMKGNCLTITDGEGWMRQYDWTIKEWTFPRKMDFSCVSKFRSQSCTTEYPCLSHVVTNTGSAIWEMANSKNSNFASYLVKMDIDDDGDVQTNMYTPPPFRYFTLCISGHCSEELLKSLKESQYSEALSP